MLRDSLVIAGALIVQLSAVIWVRRLRVADGPRSLRSWSRRVGRTRANISNREAALDWAVAAARRLSRTRWSSLGILVFIVGGLWAVPSGISIEGLRVKADADNFLSALWQVEAAVLALSLAILVFAFEAFTAGREDSRADSFYEFARETQLINVFYAGLGALIAIGMVLLEAPPGASNGSSATWATATAAGATMFLAFLVERTLVLLSPHGRLGRQRARVRRLVQAAVSEQLVELEALVLLRMWCGGRNLTLNTFLAPPLANDEVSVVAKQSGRVRDVRIRRLEFLAARAAKDEGSQPARLTVTLGSHVQAGDTLIVFRGPLSDRRSKAIARAFRVRR